LPEPNALTRKVLCVKKNAIVSPLALVVVTLMAGQDINTSFVGRDFGVVRYPDGTLSDANRLVNGISEDDCQSKSTGTRELGRE